METGRKKISIKILSVVVAALMLAGLIVPAIAAIEWPTNIERFERYDPVYTEVVEVGTAKEDLKLPETLRAVVSLPQDVDTSAFLQAEPEADMSDGYEHYDYYYYGYVAPKNVAEIYAAGEKAIYSIYYADQDEPEKVGEVAYRVYGSIDGSENMWFACDEAGSITGAILDIPVTWEGGDYDKDSEGEYTFTASFSGYVYGKARPFAKITVGEQYGNNGGHDHKRDDHDNTNAEDTLPEEPIQKPEEAENGLVYHDCHCGLDGEAIDADNFPWAHQEDCVHYSPVECMCREMVEMEVEDIDCCSGDVTGTHTELVPGGFTHIHDPSNPDCPLYGRDTVEIIKLSTGEKSVMGKDDAERIVAAQEATEAAETTNSEPTELTSSLDGENVTTYENETDVDTLDRKSSEAGSPAAENGFPSDESADSRAAAEQVKVEAGVLYPALGKIEIVEGSEKFGNSYDAKMELLSINGGGANDVAGDNAMIAATPTSGNMDYTSTVSTMTIPGSWKDYVNTLWINKAFNKFAWKTQAETSVTAYWNWDGTVASVSPTATITPASNPNCIPSPTSGIWYVYSVQQLRYALLNFTSGQTIKVQKALNFNGNMYNWGQINTGNKALILNGSNVGFFNLGSTNTANGNRSGFIYATPSDPNAVSQYNYCTFHSPKIINTADITSSCSIFKNTRMTSGKMLRTYTGLLYGTLQVFPYNVQPSATNEWVFTNCVTAESYIYAYDHVTSIFGAVSNVKNSYSVNNLVCSTGGHSGGFASCAGIVGGLGARECFVSNIEFYGTVQLATFASVSYESIIDNCYASGKMEGFADIYGFFGTAPISDRPSIITNCYSTMLVGLRSEAKRLGGFVGTTLEWGTYNTPVTVRDCYAAGEVGNFTTDINQAASAPFYTGGFAGYIPRANGLQATNCYYDKQTTAMREVATGVTNAWPGVTGVLTTASQTSGGQRINGLTDDPTAAGAGTLGFTGFSDNTQWVYTANHYPQLNKFASAATGDWYNAAEANLVRACSLASTSTVMLNTWSEGYDWDDNGVRTVNKVSYDRTLASTGKPDHKGNEYTYDTVREITSPFTATPNASYAHMVGSGAPSMSGTTPVTNTVVIDNTAKTGTTENPGMDWYRISATSGGQTGSRPIRLIGYMGIEAGTNHTSHNGETYDHRPDVVLTMMDTLTDNLVVGLDDSEIWSTSKQGGYPASKKFWAVPTTHMETNFSASRDAWLYTEVWRAKQNADGSYVQDTANQYGYVEGTNKLVPDISVKVTGVGTGNGLTLDEQRWNGELPLYPDTSIQRKYIVAYYWMLSDGRYATDYKIITIEPGEYDLKLDVLSMQAGLKTDPVNASSLYIGTGIDNALGQPGYTLTTGTATHAETLDIGYTKNVAAAWKKLNGDILVVKTQVDLYANDTNKTLMGTATIAGDLQAGDTLTIPVKYYYYDKEYDSAQQANREVIKQETVNVTYTVAQDANGALYLRFNKLANVPSDETTSATGGTNDPTGIPAAALAYINDIQFNTEITLWVRSGMDFEFIKTDKDGNAFGEGEATFQLYRCTHTHNAYCGGLVDPAACNHYHKIDAGGHPIPGEDNHSEIANNEAGNCWAVEGSSVLTATTDANGKVLFEKLSSGDYMLAETSTRPGCQLPAGQWLIQVDAVAGTVTIKARGETPPAFATETSGGVTILKLPNYPKMTFPATGGMGTILFTIGGIALVGVAVALLVINKRKKKK